MSVDVGPISFIVCDKCLCVYPAAQKLLGLDNRFNWEIVNISWNKEKRLEYILYPEDRYGSFSFLLFEIKIWLNFLIIQLSFL